MNTKQLIPISGNTFPVKEKLKALGARWNGDQKAWMIAPGKSDEARAIVDAAGPVKPRPSGGRSYGARSYGRGRGARTGCSCGSRDGESRDSDCRQCRFDECDN